MTYISTCIRYTPENLFELMEIYVGNDEKTYVFSKDSKFLFTEHDVPFWVFARPNLLMSLYMTGPIRYINERDGKSLAKFISEKITDVDLSSPIAEKALFDVLSEFGMPYGE